MSRVAAEVDSSAARFNVRFGPEVSDGPWIL
jgi:hypothetical protein